MSAPRRATRGLGAALLLLLAVAAGAARTFEGVVVAVNDGDTLVVRSGGRNLRVRLAEVDAPELHQPYGYQARELLSRLVLERTVRLEVVTVDQYDRLVAHVRTEDGRDVGEELLRAGLAWWYRQYSRNRFLQQLEQQAREQRRGLWAEQDPVPPWLYRRMHPIVR